MKTSKYKDFDLYGFENTILMALKDYQFVSIAPKRVTLGSRTYKTSQFVKFNGTDNIKAVVCHRDGNITVKAERATLKFWN